VGQNRRAAGLTAMTKKRIYRPRIVGGQVMIQADFERLHKYMREIERIDHLRRNARRRGERVAGACIQAAAETAARLISATPLMLLASRPTTV
jgi:hypothetical protein